MLESLLVAAGALAAAVAVANALRAWVSSRRSDVSVTIHYEGRSVEINARSVDADTLAELLRKILASSEGNEDEEPSTAD